MLQLQMLGNNNLDLAYFYSSPLVKSTRNPEDPTKDVLYPIYSHLNYKSEYNGLISILKNNMKDMAIQKMPLNFESFK